MADRDATIAAAAVLALDFQLGPDSQPSDFKAAGGAAVDAAEPHITRANARALRALGHEAAASALERGLEDLEDEGATDAR